MWDRTNEYKKEIGWNNWIKLFILNWMLKWLRMWDFQASGRHDITLANSSNVAKRLKKYYWLDAKVIYPNVEVDRFKKEVLENFELPVKNYYIIISALTEFKKIDVSIKAFNKMSDKNLVIVWAGNFRESLEKMAEKNIYFTGPKYWDELVTLLQNSSWLIFSGEEDFGIVPIEAFWAGKPVFAYKWWWLAETMIEWVTWEFFEDRNWDDFVEKFRIFDENIKSWKYNAWEIQEVAEKYSQDEFERQIREVVGG
jgi:glycosyltransferase involved in cell wall biosynthesis